MCKEVEENPAHSTRRGAWKGKGQFLTLTQERRRKGEGNIQTSAEVERRDVEGAEFKWRHSSQ